MAEDFVRRKALDVALQLELYLQAYPAMTVADLQNDPKFREMAVQPVGKTGYTAVYESDTAITRFHRNSGTENLDLHSLSQKLPDFWAIMEASLEGRYSHGYYQWKEPNGDLRDKFMYIAPLSAKTAEGVRFNVAATTYINEFTRSIQAAQDVSHSTTRYLTMTANRLIESFGTTGFLFMGIGVALVLALACWAGLYFSRAITHLREATRAVNQGAFDTRLKRTMSGDVGELIEDFNQMIAQLATTTVRKEHLEVSEKELRTINAKLQKEIIDRKLAEEALRESEEKYRYLVESANSIILRMDVDGNVNFFNEFAQRFFGYTEEKILGRNVVGTIVPETESTGRDLRAMIKDIGRNPDRYATNENENMCHDGRRVWIAWTNKPIYYETGAIMEVLCVGNDVTDRKQAEEAVREAYNIINRSPAVTFLWKNAEGWPVEFVSDNVDELFGYKAEEFTSGKISYARAVHPDDLERVGEEITTFSAEKGREEFTHVPYRIITKDGEVKWLDDMTFIRRDGKGDITHYEGIVLDISERVKAEDAKEGLQVKLQRSQKMESLGLLAGGVAHDLNNVLSGIVSYPELLLLDLPEDSKLRRPIETMQESGHRAAAIVQDLLTVARGVASTKEPLNLNDLVSDYLNSPEFKKLKKFHPAITINANPDSDLLNILGSDVHIRKVVMNLISNASEAIDRSGTVTISTVNRYVDKPLKGYDDVTIGEYVVLAVSDDGSGISSGDLERIFEPFYTKKVMGRSGTGLGLAVVWNVVQDHEGYIDVKSDENGTTFELYFPITRDEISDKALSIPIKDYKGNQETILVVDDVESQREIACKMLDTLGYKAKAVSSGEEAIEYLKENNVDLILLDMIMDPGINGRETYERIIKIQPNQKAIIASGFAETDDVKEAQRLGAGQYIKKPLTLEKMGIAIRDELKK